MTGELTDADREALRGLGQGQVPAAVVAILGDHYERWEWNYGERVRRLTSELEDARARLAATEIKLAAARLALAACRDAREARARES